MKYVYICVLAILSAACMAAQAKVGFSVEKLMIRIATHAKAGPDGMPGALASVRMGPWTLSDAQVRSIGLTGDKPAIRVVFESRPCLTMDAVKRTVIEAGYSIYDPEKVVSEPGSPVTLSVERKQKDGVLSGVFTFDEKNCATNLFIGPYF